MDKQPVVQRTGYETNNGWTINVESYKRLSTGWQVKGKGSSNNIYFLSDKTKIG